MTNAPTREQTGRSNLMNTSLVAFPPCLCVSLRGELDLATAGDLPQDPAERDSFLLRVMGSPDRRQIFTVSIPPGFVYQPGWLPNFSLSVDTYRVKIRDAIAQLGLPSPVVHAIERSIAEAQIAVNGRMVQQQGRIARGIRETRAGIGFVFQQFNLVGRMQVLTNVMAGNLGRMPLWRTMLRLFTDDQRRIAVAALERVGIAQCAFQRASTLSGGQQQRAAIARALCMEPRALLFDEPTSALDPELELEVIRVIKALAEEGRTMLLVTHDMRLAADVADHVMFLHEGRVEEEGPPQTLFGQPKTERLRGFLNTAAA